jgi:hypothetical protein
LTCHHCPTMKYILKNKLKNALIIKIQLIDVVV